jgi:hypothetical protein
VRRERAVTCEDDVDGGLEREGEGAWDVFWEVEGGEVHLSCKQWRPFYSREREHEARGSAERARPVSANGVKRGGVGGCCGLRCAAGESWRDGRGRDGLVQREQVMAVGRGPGWFSSFLPCLTAWVGAGEAGLDRGRKSTTWLQDLGEREQRCSQ